MSTEQENALRERRKAMYDQDFLPNYTPNSMPNPEVRLALAAEYAAYQLGQLNRKLDLLIGAAGRISTKM